MKTFNEGITQRSKKSLLSNEFGIPNHSNHNDNDQHYEKEEEYYYYKKNRSKHHRSSYKVAMHPYKIMAYLRRLIWKCTRRINSSTNSISTSISTNSTRNSTRIKVLLMISGSILFVLFLLRHYYNSDGAYSTITAVHKRNHHLSRSNYYHHQDYSLSSSSSITNTNLPIWILRFGTSSSNESFQFNSWGTDLNTLKPDYGDLKLTFVENNPILNQSDKSITDAATSFTRSIQPDPEAHHGHVWTQEEYEPDAKYFDTYYAFDDDYVRNTQFLERHQHCRRTAFHRLYFPNCNLFHELPMQHGKLLGEGAYREAYLLHERYDPDIVVKLNRFHGNPYEYDRYEFIRMDALVMERLSASPRIVDMYGHCATSVNTEFLPDELEPLIIPGDGDGENLNDKDDVDPQNDLTITEKLDYALQMAEAIADLHGYKEGVLVHDDIQTVQFLFAPDGRLKLNDFNRAEAMLFDEESGEYCKYQNGAGGGDFRAPEEYVDGVLNEKIDNYSYGNILYALMTGLWNFYQEEKVQKKIDKIKAGKIPYIDPRYRNRNYIQDRLIYVMEQCWKFDPDERADIFWVVKYLRETKDQATKMGFYKKEFVDLHFQDWPVTSVV